MAKLKGFPGVVLNAVKDSADHDRIQLPYKPGKPFRSNEESVDTIRISWRPPKPQMLFSFIAKHRYEVQYKNLTQKEESEKSEESDWISCKVDESFLMLEYLPSGSKFVFRVRVDDNGNTSLYRPFSELSDVIETVKSAASRMLPELADFIMEDAEVPVKRLPLNEETIFRNEDAKIRKIEIGKKSNSVVTEKTIMMVGQTGAGKSTLIDAMINYVFGVSRSDPLRLTVVENLESEEKKVRDDIAKCQTAWISCYTIHQMRGSRIPYKLKVIDTPGFGHEDGSEADAKITEQFRKFFTADDNTAIQSIDAVCFVMKTSDTRLTPSQQYIFNSVFSIFGKDIMDNICIMITYADEKTPKCLAALKAGRIQFKEYFRFNNSCVFADTKNKRSELNWNMGQDEFRNFFDTIEKMSTKSLSLSKEVLKGRQRLEITVSNLIDKLSVTLQNEKSMEEEIRLLVEIEKDVKMNENFTYKVTEMVRVKQMSERFNLNCLTCKYTCHKRCLTLNFDAIIRLCEVFEQGKCTQCDGKCNANSHRNENAIYVYKANEVTRVYTDLKQEYEKAAERKFSHEKLIAKMRHDMEKHDKEIEGMYDSIVCSIIRLREIALLNDPCDFEDFFEMMLKDDAADDIWMKKRLKLLNATKKLNKCVFPGNRKLSDQ